MEDMKILLLDRYDLDMKNIELQRGGWAALAYKAVDGTNSYFLKVYEKNRASTPKLTALIGL